MTARAPASGANTCASTPSNFSQLTFILQQHRRRVFDIPLHILQKFRTHGSIDTNDYKQRIEAINYTLSHDDGVTNQGLEQADVILVGVSRCGKTPTSLYLAMQFGVKAANFPLIPEDFERMKMPDSLVRHRDKLFGLTIQPERLNQIRSERRPNSKYASLENCRYEVKEAEKMMRQHEIRWLDSSTKSIEEISTTIMQEVKLERLSF